MSPFYNLSEYILKNQEALALEIVDSVVPKFNMAIPKQEKEQALNMYIHLLGFFAETLLQEENESAPDALIEWSKKNAEMQAASGGKISDIVVRYGPTREVFNELLTNISIRLELSLRENAYVIKLINSVLDVSVNETVSAFERLSEQFREDTQKELMQLSAPIVPVKQDVVILPLIGYIDAERASYITDTVIPQIAEMNVSHVIADFSGVLTIDIYVAESLHRIGGTLRLMGITVIATGLRPKLAQIAVQSNISMASLKTFSTVKQALENIGQ